MAERQFGPFRLVHQIATGGMAEIYLAKTKGIGGFEKYVALKMIHPNFSQDEHFIQMLVDEAKISVRLQHINIGQVFDLGRVDQTFYITMEYVDGCDLYQLLRTSSDMDRFMPVDICAHIAREVCTALDYAHRMTDDSGKPLGIIHRDISPQNVLLSTHGEVKLVDFGIAKATMRARQTAVGVIKGKYYYMSPEQAWGDDLDQRTDLFSAGILLYEMLAGQMLYLEEDMQLLLHKVRKAEIAPVSTLRRDTPPELQHIVTKALAKRREDRWQSAHDFGAALDRFLQAHAPDFSPARIESFIAATLTKKPGPAPEKPPSRPNIATNVSGEYIVKDRSEFTDENSLIFNFADYARRPTDYPRDAEESTRDVPFDFMAGNDDDVLANPANPFAEDTSPPKRQHPKVGPPKLAPKTAPASPPTTDEDSLDESFDEGERTMISGPPAFGAPTTEEPDRFASFFEDSQVGEDPTGQHGVDTDLAARKPRPPSRDATPTERNPVPGERPLAPSKLLAEGVPRGTPSPAVSVLRDPRPSRGTPAMGVPTAPPGDAPTVPVRRNPSIPPPPPPGATRRPTMPPPPVRGSVPLSDGFAPPPLPPAPFPRPATAEPDAYRIERDSKLGKWLLIAGALLLLGLGVAIVTSLGGDTAPAESNHAVLEITSFPAGAEVFLDGKRAGKTDLKVDVDRGRDVNIRITMDRYEEWKAEESVDRPRLKVVAVLKPRRGTLYVKSTPPGAEVFIANRSLGRTPLTKEDLDPFEDTEVEVRLQGFKPQRKRLEWAGDNEKTLEFALDRR